MTTLRIGDTLTWMLEELVPLNEQTTQHLRRVWESFGQPHMEIYFMNGEPVLKMTIKEPID